VQQQSISGIAEIVREGGEMTSLSTSLPEKRESVVGLWSENFTTKLRLHHPYHLRRREDKSEDFVSMCPLYHSHSHEEQNNHEKDHQKRC
jgi:hypothetical protein